MAKKRELTGTDRFVQNHQNFGSPFTKSSKSGFA